MRDIEAISELSHGAGETSSCLKRIQWVSKNAFSGKAWFWAASPPNLRADLERDETLKNSDADNVTFNRTRMY